MANSQSPWSSIYTSKYSQYTLGCASGCTCMALEYCLALLYNVKPSEELVEKILLVGSSYASEYHTALFDVLSNVKRYNQHLEEVGTRQRMLADMEEIIFEMVG